jgi:hypothetical protein
LHEGSEGLVLRLKHLDLGGKLIERGVLSSFF